MQVKPVKTRIFKEGEDLATFIRAHIPKLKEGSVLVVTSKIVALAEGRTLPYPNEKARERAIASEGDFVLRTKHTWLTLKDRMIMSSAGIDASNADGKLILLPKDCYAAAKKLRTELLSRYSLTSLGVVITDSRVLPLRQGAMGVALGYAGIKGLRSYLGKKDLFGRAFQFSQANVVDGLASAAVLVMGEGAERIPLVVVEDAPVEFAKTVRRNELLIRLENDIYLPFFEKFPKSLRKRIGG